MNEFRLRMCGPEDAAGLRRVAERDCAPVPPGRVLGAEADGVLVAAIEVDTGRVVADPFAPTADLVDLLRRRAEQIRKAESGRGPALRVRRARLGRSAA